MESNVDFSTASSQNDDDDENVNLVTISKQWEAHETTEHKMESNVDFSTASSQNDDDEQTLAETLVNIKRNAEKDKGKAIMQDFEPPKKIKKKEMIQIDLDEALAQKLQAEELVKSTARQEQEQYDFEKALELQKKLEESEEVVAKSSQAYDIDWRRIFQRLIYEDIRPIFERVWDQNNSFVPKDSEIEKEVMKRSGFVKKQVEEEIVQKEDVIAEQVYVEVISDSEEIINVTPLAVKFPIVGWKSNCKEDVRYYEIHKADRSYKTYIFFSQMLNDFDKEDLIRFYRLFSESQELIEWRLYDSCGVHSLMLEEVRIHMLVEKKYPLPQDTVTRMLRWKLHVNYNITEMTYELLRLIRSQLNQ
ncbi:hypothetical protein Tco_0849357 [Tanacetum coccineum]